MIKTGEPASEPYTNLDNHSDGSNPERQRHELESVSAYLDPESGADISVGKIHKCCVLEGSI